MLEPEFAVKSGLYIDVENLLSNARELIVALLENWPATAPYPTKVTLYVRADMVELWQMWAYTNIYGPLVEVRGIQHFTTQQSKNSADIAIAVDAISDLLNGQIHHVAVFSDDSDFISLFAKIRTTTEEIQQQIGRIPFLWVLTDREGTKTPNIRQFFPSEYLFVASATSQPQDTGSAPELVQLETLPKNSENSQAIEETICESIIREIPLGVFKSTACKAIIVGQFPEHPMSRMTDAALGTAFLKELWPILKRKGVGQQSNTKPLRYEMTQEAKDAISAN